MQKNHRANVWITPETRDQLKAIGKAHGAEKGRELSPGIRVAAGFHGRLVEQMDVMAHWVKEYAYQMENYAVSDDAKDDLAQARALLKEIEEAR